MAVQLGSADSGNLGFGTAVDAYLHAAQIRNAPQNLESSARQYAQRPVTTDPETVPGGMYTDAQHGAAQDAQALQQDRFGLSAWLNQQELTQKETLRLQQMKQAVSDVMANPNLSEQEKQDMVLRLRTGVDHLSMRQAAAQTARVEQQTRLEMEGNARQQSMMQMDATGWNNWFRDHPPQRTPGGQEMIVMPDGHVHLGASRAEAQAETREERVGRTWLEDSRHRHEHAERLFAAPVGVTETAERRDDRIRRMNEYIANGRRDEGVAPDLQEHLNRHIPGRRARLQAEADAQRQRDLAAAGGRVAPPPGAAGTPFAGPPAPGAQPPTPRGDMTRLEDSQIPERHRAAMGSFRELAAVTNRQAPELEHLVYRARDLYLRAGGVPQPGTPERREYDTTMNEIRRGNERRPAEPGPQPAPAVQPGNWTPMS